MISDPGAVRRAKEIEKILDRDYRFSIKYWTAYQVAVQESLETGLLPDGTIITDRPEIEGIATFIEENLHRIRECIAGIEDLSGVFNKAILEWMSELPEDLDESIPRGLMRSISRRSGELVKIKNMEEQELEKWI